MKQLKFLAPVAIGVSMTALLFSCNSGDEKKADETTVDTTAAKVMEPAAPAKPANVMLIMHKVANFAKWKPMYESHDSVRLASGLHNYILARGIKDSNMVMVALKMDDAAKAKEFTGSAGIKERMQKAGVIGMPAFNYVDIQMLDTTFNAITTRVIITHRVKDYDAWKKEFDSHKQARLDAGLTDRALGYSVGDNHLVTIVFTVSDMKKAEAFMSSKDLKDKMTAAGVEGPPSIFFYNVVQKY